MKVDVLQEHSVGPFGPWYQIAYNNGEMIDYDSDWNLQFEPPVSGYFPAANVLIQPTHHVRTQGVTLPIQQWTEIHHGKWKWYGVWH